MPLKANETQVAKVSGVRRSQRVYLSVDIAVVLHRPNENSVREETTTLVVNAHGALLLLRTAVVLGDLVSVRNLKSQEEQSCRVVDIVKPATLGVPEVGVEFLVPARNFWHIAFPPADWTPRSPEARGFQQQPKPEVVKK